MYLFFFVVVVNKNLSYKSLIIISCGLSALKTASAARLPDSTAPSAVPGHFSANSLDAKTILHIVYHI